MFTKKFERHAFRGWTPEKVAQQAEKESKNIGKVQECSWLPKPATLIRVEAETDADGKMFISYTHKVDGF